MKKANLPLRAEEWENEGEGSGTERERGVFCWSLFVYEGGKLRVTA